MKKGFTTFLSALKANTPPCKKGLSSRKFLSLFLILFLAVGNVWGQELTHTNPATDTVANRVFLDLQGTPSNVTVGTDNYSNYGPGYFIQNKTTLSWWSFSGTFKSSSSSYSNASNAVGFQSPGSSSASEFYQKLQMREGSDRMTQMDFYVKGTTSVGFQWKNGGTSNKYLTFTIYEMNVTGTTATDESTPVATVTGNTTSSSVQYAATEILDGSKYYHIQVTPKGTSNIDLYGLTFKHAQETANLTWNFDGGSCSGTAGTDYTAPGAVAIGGEIKYPDDAKMSKDGYNFNGWDSDVKEMPDTDLTITAQWVSASATESAINYAETKGADMSAYPATYYEGVGIESFDPLTDVTDYHFVGWEPAFISTEATGDQTITAQWVSAYNIEFNAGTGTGDVPAAFQKWDGATFELPAQGALVAPAGKEFAGWSDGTTTYAAGDTYTMGAAAVTFTAQWKAAPTVLFHYQWTGSSTQPAVGDVLTGIGGTITVERKESSTKTLSNESAKFVSSVPSDMKFTTSDSKGVKFGTSDVWFRIALNSGNFEEGDTIAICGYEAFLISSSTAFDGDISSSLSTGSNKENYEVKQCVIPSIESFPNLYIRRVSSSCGFAAIKVIRPAQKEILSEDITLSAVTVNTEAISDENLATLKTDPSYKLDLTSEYAEAPTIAFTKQTVITYEDATTKTKTEAIEVEAAKVDGKWQAQAEINGVTYTVTAIVPATYTVIYKDGETELASEIVKVGEHPTAEGVETKPLYALSWKLAEEVVELANVDGTADQEIILTAVWTPKYAETIDFTNYVQEERLTKSLADVLKDGNHNYICGGTFNNSEWGVTSENAAYQGYKFKDNGVYIEFLLKSGMRATFLFGNYGSTGTIKVGTAEATECTPSDSKYVVNATSEDVLVRFTTGGTGTVTLKSITIGEIPTISDDATLTDLKVNGTTIAGFNSATTIYYLTVPYGTEVANMPKITEAIAKHPSAEAVIYPAEGPEWTEEYGGCYLQQVVVTAEDEITKGYYHVRTTVDAKQGVSLIKATHTGATTADVTGYIGGSVDKNTQGGGKLGSNGHYFGIKLAEGTFLAGDVVTIYASTVSSKVQIFSDKGTTMINEGVFDGNYYTYTLTEATEWIYLYRTETAGSAMNPTLGYIEVQRDMAPFIESFVIGEAVGTIDQTNKTIAIEVPASTDVTALTPTIVAYANGGATVTPATAQDFSSPVEYTVNSAYPSEDAATVYTVTVTKAAAIKEVVISGTLSVLEDETITLSATVIDTNDAEASNQNVTWKSNDETTATVDANGVVTGVKVGTVTITATSVADNTKSASVTITVTENPCRTWNAPAESFSGDITKGKLSIKNSGCSIDDVNPFSGASKVYAYKIDGNSDYVELSFTDKSQFETLTLGVSSGSNGSTPTFVVVASKSAVFDEKTIVEIFTYNANAKDAEQSLVDVSIPEGTRNVRIYRKYNDIGDGSSVYVYYVNACKKEFVPVTKVSVNNAKLGKGKSLNLKAIITPANADIESLAWSIESMTATNVTILGNVLTAAENATEGDVVVKVVATDVLSNVVEATATISIVDKFEVVKPVTATQVWNWAPVAVGEGETIADPDTVLANYISGDEWEMLAGNVGGRPYRNTDYKAYQGTSLYFKAAVPGLLIMYAGRTSNDKDVFVNGTKVGTVKSNKAYMDTIAVQAGDVYITSESMRIYWMKFDTDFASYEITDNLFNGYTRDVRQGYYGTICLPNGGVMVGAAVYEIAYMDYKDDAPYKIYFDEILNGKMEAGVPYIFLPNEGADKLAVFYTDEANESAKNANGLYGFIGASATDEYKIPGGAGNYIIQNNQYREVLAGADARIVSNRAYIKLSEVPGYNNPLYVAPEPAPGRKRVAMGTTGEQVATGVDQVRGDEVPTKMIINGQLFILRGEKMYDAQGKLVR